MRAIRPTKTGGPEVLLVTEVPTPVPGEGQALVRVEAAGVNNVDLVQRAGIDKVPTPILLGVEGAGVIEAVGAGVTDLSIGQRVAWAKAKGSYATHVVVPEVDLVPVPDGIDAKTAAAVMVHGLLGHFLTRDTYRVEPGTTCLIFAALMGAAPMISRIAKKFGAEIFAVIPDKLGVSNAKANGAAHVTLASDRGLPATIDEGTRGRGVDVVYDQVGAKTIEASMTLVRTRGTVVLYGHLGEKGPRIDPRTLADHGSIFLTRPVLRDYIATKKELRARTSDLFAWVKDGSIKVTVDGAFPLGAARLAHERMEGKPNGGKILLLP
jgi:NADPH:quinone reductase